MDKKELDDYARQVARAEIAKLGLGHWDDEALARFAQSVARQVVEDTRRACGKRFTECFVDFEETIVQTTEAAILSAVPQVENR